MANDLVDTVHEVRKEVVDEFAIIIQELDVTVLHKTELGDDNHARQSILEPKRCQNFNLCLKSGEVRW